jgi:7-dehydrocholesterol reductase
MVLGNTAITRQRRPSLCGSVTSSSFLETDAAFSSLSPASETNSKKVSFEVPRSLLPDRKSNGNGLVQGPKDHVNPAWGRFAGNEWLTVLGCAAIVVFCPLLAVLSWVCLENFDGALFPTLYSFITTHPVEFVRIHFPRPSRGASVAYVAWLLFQAALYAWVPSPVGYGQRTPAGHLLPYRVNGIHAWVITHAMAVAATMAGALDPAIIAKNWPGLLVAANVYGYILAIFSYVKAHLFPTHEDDRKFSGVLHPFVCGDSIGINFGRFHGLRLLYGN